MRKPILGLIGAIGAGKSAAAAFLAARGGFVIDADRVGHDALEEDNVKLALRDHWGAKVFDGDRINRKAVAAVVFADPAERGVLEGIVFPVIRKRTEAMIAVAESTDAKFIVLDAATLLEAGWTGLLDKLLYIDAPRNLREERVKSRGWTPDELTRREKAQWPADVKRTKADAVIDNAGTREDLQAALDRLLSQWGWN